MRTIDAHDALRRINESRADNPFFNGNTDTVWEKAHDSALLCVLESPTIDAVEVVRCKDCNKWSGVALGSRCKHFSFPPLAYCYTNADDFCSRGERNEG